MRDGRRHAPEFHVAAKEHRHGVAGRSFHAKLRVANQLRVDETLQGDREDLLHLVRVLGEHRGREVTDLGDDWHDRRSVPRGDLRTGAPHLKIIQNHQNLLKKSN